MRKKSGTSHREFHSSGTQECDGVTLTPYYPISAISSVKNGHLWKVEIERNFQTFSSKRGGGCLREVVALQDIPDNIIVI